MSDYIVQESANSSIGRLQETFEKMKVSGKFLKLFSFINNVDLGIRDFNIVVSEFPEDAFTDVRCDTEGISEGSAYDRE